MREGRGGDWGSHPGSNRRLGGHLATADQHTRVELTCVDREAVAGGAREGGRPLLVPPVAGAWLLLRPVRARRRPTA
jgi:hypothetical protein